MSKQNLSSLRLRRAVSSVVEKLEERRMMAADPSAVQLLPYLLDFGSDRGGVVDKDGEGTGFTRVQTNAAGNEYQPTLIDLQPATGIIKITAQGTASAGTNYNGDNTLKNALETQFDATVAGGFTTSVRLVGPLTNFTSSVHQAGLMFGADQDNYVKLVAVNEAGKQYVQFTDEQTTGGVYTHSLTGAASYYSVGTFSSITSLDLILIGDPATGKLSAYYRVNDGATTKVAGEITLSGAKKTAFFSTTARAGLIAAKKSNSADFTATFDKFEIVAGNAITNRPSVIATRPANGATGVSPDGFVAADLSLPNVGKGVDSATLTATSMRLYRTSDRAMVDAVLNTDGAGGSLVLQPTSTLDANTSYTFEVTDELKDTSGASFLPYSSSFMTGNLVVQPDSSIAFEKVTLPTTAGTRFTGVTFGPDGKLYASTDEGDIYRWMTNADGTLGSAQVITSIKAGNGGESRLVTGVAFDPASTSDNLILWVTHSDYAQLDAANLTGKISRLSGVNLATYQDYVVDLPRSIRDHTTNQPVFGPDGKLYFQQGSMTAMGGSDSVWGGRPEHLLSAAVLQVDTAAITARIAAGQGALNVRTTDVGGSYDPYAADAPLKLYATGLRNAYDLLWHSNGHLYAPTNGSAAGGALPATPTTSAIARNNQTQDDWLYDVKSGKYYGHPNPTRNELYAHGGNPTSAVDPNEVAAYPVGTPKDANYAAPAYIFGKNYSPNGVIEYKSNAFNGALKGKMLVSRYSGADDILVLDVRADGSIGAAQTGLAGLTHFTDPLDVIENTANGFLYVAEYGGERITLLRPIVPGAHADYDKKTFYFNDVRGDAKAGPTQTLTITNTGTAALALTSDGLTIGGADASQFTFVNKPTLPTTIQPGQSLAVKIAMNASSTGLKVATLTVKSNDPNQPIATLALRGLGTAGTGGQNEPSLQAILNLYQIPIATGDANPNNTDLYNASEPLGPSDEVAMQRLVRAGAGPVTITSLASMGVGTTPVFTFGYYEAGTPSLRTNLFNVATADAQSVNATLNGQTTFDPGTKSFGVYTTWPAFKNADNVTFRDSFSEDALNTWDAAAPHKVRFYALKNADGTVVPNAYVMAYEEFSAIDSNDFVGIIYNVMPAPAGPELGWENRDNVGLPNRLVFNRLNTLDANNPNVVHDTVVLRLRNTGSQDLVINGVTASAGWTVGALPAGPIAAGAFYDLSVKFVSTTTGMRNGTLTITSNDADEPSVQLALAGFVQAQSEGGTEGTLQTLINLFGYKTQATYAGQNINTGGLASAIGDEVLSSYWARADAQAPVQVRQLAAFHTQGNSASIAWHGKGSTSTSNLITHDRAEGQSILPHKSGTALATPAFATFNPSGAFGLKIDAEWSDDTKNPQEKPGGNYGHHLRFYPAKDANGVVIPNTYLVTMDYLGINYDYQDNIYLVTNIKPEAPAAPANVVATGSGAGIALDWSDNNPNNLAGYNVYRSTSATGTFTKLNASPVATSDYADATAPAGATSYYKVVAVDRFGTESAATTASAARVADTTPPAQVTGLVATGSGAGISLSWNANVEADLVGYNVYRSGSLNGSYTKQTASPLTGTSFVDANAPSGVVSYYRVTAVDAAGLESTPATASATRSVDSTAPVAPTGLIANGSTSNVALDWDNNTESDLAGYNVYYSTSAGGTFTKRNGSPLAASSFIDANAPAGVVSYYRVTAVDTNGNESAFAATSATRLDDGVAPAAPTGLTALGAASGVTLDWADNTEPDLAGYNVFRATSATGTFVKVNASVLTASTFADAQAPAGATSYYRVVAVDVTGNASANSATASAARPAVNTGAIRTIAGGAAFTDSAGNTWSPDNANWTASNINTTAVAIADTNDDPLYYQRRWGADFTYTKAVANGDYTLKLLFTEPSYAAAGKRVFGVSVEGTQVLTNFDLYVAGGNKYRVPVARTFNVTVTDGALTVRFFSSVENAIISGIELIPTTPPETPTTPVAPTGLTATAASSTQVNLAWTDNASNETGYRVERSTDGSTFSTAATLGANATSYSDSGRAASTTYSYRVVAIGSAADSMASNVATATTAAAPVAGTTLRVQAGNANYTDTQGQTWTAGAGWAGTSGVNTTAVDFNNTNDDPLYYNRRFGADFTYSSTVANGTYTLKLYFAEPVTTYTAGKRVFSVAAEGANILTNFDISKEAGVRNPLVKTFTVNVADGAIDLRFVSSVENALISAIELIPANAPAPTGPAAPANFTATATSGTAITLGWSDVANETGFTIERSTNGGTTFAPLVTVGAGVTSYSDANLTAGTTYTYRLTATNATGSSPTVTASATTPTTAPVVTNVARGKFALASSSDSANRQPSAAVDGSTSTRWSSQYNGSEWIQVELGNLYTINRVKLVWEAAYGKAYKIQVSLDGSTWTDVYTEAAGNGGTDDITGLDVQARWVRMQGITRGTTYGYSLYEFEVYGA